MTQTDEETLTNTSGVLTVALLLSAIGVQACMSSPYDGASAGDRSTPLTVRGYTSGVGHPIQVQAYNYAARRFDPLATATSSGPVQDFLTDLPLYGWQTEVVLPATYWTPGACGGWAAKVRSYDESLSLDLVSVDRNYVGCLFEGNDSAVSFADNCTSENTPAANVYTADYEAACQNTIRDDFENFNYSYGWRPEDRTGRLVAGISRIVASDYHYETDTSVSIETRAVDRNFTASAVVDLVKAEVLAETLLLGYAEAGIELRLEAADPSGNTLCTDSDVVYIARYQEHSWPTGERQLGCSFTRNSGHAEDVELKVVLHVWVGAGALAHALVDVDAQMINVALQGCC